MEKFGHLRRLLVLQSFLGKRLIMREGCPQNLYPSHDLLLSQPSPFIKKFETQTSFEGKGHVVPTKAGNAG